MWEFPSLNVTRIGMVYNVQVKETTTSPRRKCQSKATLKSARKGFNFKLGNSNMKVDKRKKNSGRKGLP